MITPTTSARIFTVYDEHLPPCWFVSHPAMQRRLRIDPADPGKLSYVDGASFTQGWELVGGTLLRELIAALVEQRGVEYFHAERIVDSWENQALGFENGFIVEAIANA